jgi:hypothetical protein
MINVKQAVNKVKNHMKLEQDKSELLRQWRLVMTHCKAYNERFDTFDIEEEEKKEYGWHFILRASWGLTYDRLKTLQPIIEHNLKCHFIYEVLESNECAVCDIIYEKQIKANDIPFEPQNVKPYELYLGVRITGNPIIIDVNKTPFVLLAGATRKGKNGSLNHILISLIHSCTPEQVQIYYFQGAKGDGLMYKRCKHVYAFSLGNIMELLQMALHLEKELQSRTKLFEDMYSNFKGDNLFKYNNLNKNNQLPYVYLFIDEFLVVMPKTSDSKEIKEVKNKILGVLEKIAQFGGGLGITYVIAHQKPEKELCPSFLKNMSLTRVCFGFEDEVCSRIVLGNDMAVGLPPRRAYYLVEGKFNMLFTTNLDGRMEQFLRPHFDLKHNTLFSNLEKLKKDYRILDDSSSKPNKSNKNKDKGNGIVELPTNKNKAEEVKEVEEMSKTTETKEVKPKFISLPIEFNAVDPIKITERQKTLEENIMNIPNFVPYVPIENLNVKIIDRSNFEVIKTEKSPKLNKGKVELP